MRAKLMVLVSILSLCAGSAAGQSREEGPWWPHPIWGADDQAGGSNWITSEKVLEAMKLVEQGEVYELGQLYEPGMPLYGTRSYSILIPAAQPPAGGNRLVGNEEFVCTQIGQVGTQFDGPGHIGAEMEMADGTTREVFYNGVTREEMRGPAGLARLGVEQIKPIITRGILIDIAAVKQVGRLKHSYEVSLEDVRAALRRQGIEEDDIRAGDALFFRYGWSTLWGDPAQYNSNPPGIGLEVAAWIVERKASMVGADSWGTEVVPNPDPRLAFPVHQELITKNGIWNLENMDLEQLSAEGINEFLFILTPLPLKGATGSPGRPLAIR